MTATNNRTETSKAAHETLRQIPYNLYAICVGKQEGERNAFIGSWATQCSFSPPSIAIAVRKDTASFRLLQSEGVFTLNLLRTDQEDIARQLVKPSHRVGDKLQDLSEACAATGAPALRDCLAFLECSVVSQSDAGDHGLFVGEVVYAEQRGSGRPLSCSDVGWHYAG